MILLSFADIKADTFEEARQGIVEAIAECYHKYLLQGSIFDEKEKGKEKQRILL